MSEEFFQVGFGLTPVNLEAATRAVRDEFGRISASIKVDTGDANPRLEAAKRNVDALRNSLEGATISAEQAKRAFAQMVNSDSLVTATATTEKYRRSLQAVNTEIVSAISFSDRLGRQAELATRRFAAYTIAAGSIIALTQAMRNAFTEAVNFERQMIKLGQVGGTTQTDVKSIANTIRDLSTGLGASSNNLAEASVQLRKIGLSAAEVKTALAGIGKLEVIGNVGNIKGLGEGIGAIIKEFKVSGKDLENTFGSINAVTSNFNVSMDEISEAVKRSGAAFKASGGDFNEFLALLTSVKNTTQEDAGTIAAGLRTIFGRIQKPEVVDYLDSIGIKLKQTKSEVDAFGNTRLVTSLVSPLEQIQRISSALKSLPTTSPEFVKVLEKISDFRQSERVIPLLQNIGEAQKIYTQSLIGNIGVSDQVKGAQESLAVQLAKVREEFNKLFSAIEGNRTFRAMIQGVLELTKALTGLIEHAGPVVPILASLGSFKLGQSALQFVSGFTSGKSPYEASLGHLTGVRRYGGGFNTGGKIPGYGGGDKIPIMAEGGEYMLNKETASKIGYANLDKFNYGGLRHYADGSYVFRGISSQKEDIPDWIKSQMPKNVSGRWAASTIAGTEFYRKDAGKFAQLLYQNVPQDVISSSLNAPEVARWSEATGEMFLPQEYANAWKILRLPKRMRGFSHGGMEPYNYGGMQHYEYGDIRYSHGGMEPYAGGGEFISRLSTGMNIDEFRKALNIEAAYKIRGRETWDYGPIHNKIKISELLEKSSHITPYSDAIRHIPKGSEFVGGGWEAIGFKTPQGTAIRVGLESESLNKPFGRFNIPQMLAPYSTDKYGDIIIEHLPFAQTYQKSGIINKDFNIEAEKQSKILRKQLSKIGFDPHDVYPDNIGLTSDNLWKVIDPGAIRGFGPKFPITTHFAGGGLVPDIGKGRNIDSVPGFLPTGAFVLKKSSADSIGLPNLNAMNYGGMPCYAFGGIGELSYRQEEAGYNKRLRQYGRAMASTLGIYPEDIFHPHLEAVPLQYLQEQEHPNTIGRYLPGTQRIQVGYPQHEFAKTAFHEMGHAVDWWTMTMQGKDDPEVLSYALSQAQHRFKNRSPAQSNNFLSYKIEPNEIIADAFADYMTGEMKGDRLAGFEKLIPKFRESIMFGKLKPEGGGPDLSISESRIEELRNRRDLAFKNYLDLDYLDEFSKKRGLEVGVESNLLFRKHISEFFSKRMNQGGIPCYEDGGYGQRFNRGGMANAMLMPDEYVFSPESANRIGYGNLLYMNRTGKLPGYAEGTPDYFDAGFNFPRSAFRNTNKKLIKPIDLINQFDTPTVSAQLPDPVDFGDLPNPYAPQFQAAINVPPNPPEPLGPTEEELRAAAIKRAADERYRKQLSSYLLPSHYNKPIKGFRYRDPTSGRFAPLPPLYSSQNVINPPGQQFGGSDVFGSPFSMAIGGHAEQNIGDLVGSEAFWQLGPEPARQPSVLSLGPNAQQTIDPNNPLLVGANIGRRIRGGLTSNNLGIEEFEARNRVRLALRGEDAFGFGRGIPPPGTPGGPSGPFNPFEPTRNDIPLAGNYPPRFQTIGASDLIQTRADEALGPGLHSRRSRESEIVKQTELLHREIVEGEQRYILALNKDTGVLEAKAIGEERSLAAIRENTNLVIKGNTVATSASVGAAALSGVEPVGRGGVFAGRLREQVGAAGNFLVRNKSLVALGGLAFAPQAIETGLGKLDENTIGTPNQGNAQLGSVLSGASNYALQGALLGSFIPGVGTGIGAVAGAAYGGITSYGQSKQLIAQGQYDAGVAAFNQSLQGNGAADFGRINTGITGLTEQNSTIGGRIITGLGRAFSRPTTAFSENGDEFFDYTQEALDKRREQSRKFVTQNTGGVLEGLQRQVGEALKTNPNLTLTQLTGQIRRSGAGESLATLANLRRISEEEIVSPLKAAGEAPELQFKSNLQGVNLRNIALESYVSQFNTQSRFGQLENINRINNGGFGVAEAFNPLAGLQSVGSQNGEPFRQSLEFIANAHPGEAGTQLRSTGELFQKLSQTLPDIIKDVRAGGGVGAEATITEKLTAALPKTAQAQDFIKLIGNKTAQISDSREFLKQSTDFGAFAESLIHSIPAIQEFEKAAQVAGKGAADNLQRFSQGLTQATENAIRIGQVQDQANTVRLQAQRFGAGVIAEHGGFERTPLRGLTLEQLEAPFQLRQERLTGLQGENAVNPDLISNKLAANQARLNQLNPASTDAGEIREFNALQQSVHNLREAFDHAINPTERLAGKFERLALLNNERESRIKTGESFIGMDPIKKLQIARGLELGIGAYNAKADIQNFAPRDQLLIKEALQQFGGVNLNTVRGPVSGEGVLRFFAENQYGGLFKQNAANATERQGLQNEIGQQFEKIGNATQGLADTLQSQNALFLKGLDQVFKDYFSKAPNKAEGGVLGTDWNHANVSQGEYIVNSKATAKHFGLLQAINSDDMPRYGLGGMDFMHGPLQTILSSSDEANKAIRTNKLFYPNYAVGGMFSSPRYDPWSDPANYAGPAGRGEDFLEWMMKHHIDEGIKQFNAPERQPEQGRVYGLRRNEDLPTVHELTPRETFNRLSDNQKQEFIEFKNARANPFGYSALHLVKEQAMRDARKRFNLKENPGDVRKAEDYAANKFGNYIQTANISLASTISHRLHHIPNLPGAAEQAKIAADVLGHRQESFYSAVEQEVGIPNSIGARAVQQFLKKGLILPQIIPNTYAFRPAGAAAGGVISGGTDQIPILAAPGESILSKTATANLINQGTLEGRASQVVFGNTVGSQGGDKPTNHEHMHAAMDKFGGHVDKLVSAMQDFQVPDKISMEGNHSADININGTEGLKNIHPAMKEMMQDLISDTLHRTFKKQIPELGLDVARWDKQTEGSNGGGGGSL